MTDYLFNYSSVVVDDLASAGVYEKIGLVRVWEGEHPVFGTRGVMLATGKGGTLLLEGGATKHAALSAFTGSKERNFHINLLVQGLAAQRVRCKQSAFVRYLSDDYDGPGGRSFAVELDIGAGSLWMEFTEGKLVADARSRFECVDSTAMVARKRTDIVAPIESVSLPHSKVASDGYFKVLEGINEIIVLDWHYLEVNEPTLEKGVMANFLARMGRPGIFGMNYVPRDMAEFVAAAKQTSLDINTPEPIRLAVEVRGKEYKCADIITINPRATGGARIFILKPLEYPWELVA
jgi:hypothetical protein